MECAWAPPQVLVRTTKGTPPRAQMASQTRLSVKALLPETPTGSGGSTASSSAALCASVVVP